MNKLISIIIPVHNEAENISELYQGITTAIEKCHEYSFEFLFVNDGSRDTSVQVVQKLHDQDDRVQLIEFSRNFGKEAATTAGLRDAQGQAVIMIDADMQHPPHLIPEFIKRWEEGCEVVIGKRRNSSGDGIVKNVGTRMFYAILNIIADQPITPHATDYRLLDRVVVDAVNGMTEHNRLTRGLIDWLGFRRCYIEFESPPRRHGVAGYSTFKLMNLALHSVVSHSLFPLRLAGYLGIVITMFSGALGLFMFLERYFFNEMWQYNFSGPAVLAVIILFLIGIVLSCLGLIALYIASIRAEVQNRPLYVVRKRIK